MTEVSATTAAARGGVLSPPGPGPRSGIGPSRRMAQPPPARAGSFECPPRLHARPDPSVRPAPAGWQDPTGSPRFARHTCPHGFNRGCAPAVPPAPPTRRTASPRPSACDCWGPSSRSWARSRHRCGLLVALLSGPDMRVTVALVIACAAADLGLRTACRAAPLVHLDEAGYRVRFLRGAGRREAARWREVEDVVTATVPATTASCCRLRDGRTTTIPVNVLDAPPDGLHRGPRGRLDTRPRLPPAALSPGRSGDWPRSATRRVTFPRPLLGAVAVWRCRLVRSMAPAC